MDTRAITRGFILVGLLVCLALLGGLPETMAGGDAGYLAPRSPSGFRLSEPHFAIGDFDGDQKPDLATVEVVPDSRRATRYSIHLQLSFGPRSAIGLTAPLGGLLLSARDVNGDRALDLVVTTALDAQLVAVLVNDGHGNFTLAPDGAFPELKANGNCQVGAPTDPISKQTALLQSRCPTGDEVESTAAFDSPSSSEQFLTPAQKNAARCDASVSLGRSPPTACILP